MTRYDTIRETTGASSLRAIYLVNEVGRTDGVSTSVSFTTSH